MLVTVLAAIMAGCATAKGPKFAESGDVHAVPPSGQTLIYVVRPSAFADSANSWKLKLNGKPLVIVPNGGYHVFTNSPGALSFTTKLKYNALNFSLLTVLLNGEKEILKLDAQPDRTYYLKLFGRTLRQLTDEEGRRLLGECKKILVPWPSAAETKPQGSSK